MKLLALLPVPPAVVTLMGPVFAQSGTVAVIEVEELKVTVGAFTPLKLTVAARVNFVPVMLTLVPARALAGVKFVIIGMSEMSSRLNFVTNASTIWLTERTDVAIQHPFSKMVDEAILSRSGSCACARSVVAAFLNEVLRN